MNKNYLFSLALSPIFFTIVGMETKHRSSTAIVTKSASHDGILSPKKNTIPPFIKAQSCANLNLSSVISPELQPATRKKIKKKRDKKYVYPNFSTKTLKRIISFVDTPHSLANFTRINRKWHTVVEKIKHKKEETFHKQCIERQLFKDREKAAFAVEQFVIPAIYKLYTYLPVGKKELLFEQAARHGYTPFITIILDETNRVLDEKEKQELMAYAAYERAEQKATVAGFLNLAEKIRLAKKDREDKEFHKILKRTICVTACAKAQQHLKNASNYYDQAEEDKKDIEKILAFISQSVKAMNLYFLAFEVGLKDFYLQEAKRVFADLAEKHAPIKSYCNW